MKKILNVAIAIAVVATALTGCKKGANDPFLSLKSRKARLKGEWKLVKMEGTDTYTAGDGIYSSTTTITADGTTLSEKRTISSGGNSQTITDSYPYSVDFTVNKDGTYKTVTNDDGDIITSEGNWAFIGKSKSAGLKNKEAIALSETSYSDTGNQTTNKIEGDFYFGIDNVYIMDKLSSKELVVVMQYSGSNQDGDKWTGDYTMTFEKQ